MVRRLLIIILIIATFLLGNVANFWLVWWLFSKVDQSIVPWPGNLSAQEGMLIDIGLLMLYFILHSLFATRRFWRIISLEGEGYRRSLYVCFAGLTIIGVTVHWVPVPNVIWQTTEQARLLLDIIYWIGCAIVVVSQLCVDIFAFLGVRDLWLLLLGKKGASTTTETLVFRGPYRYCRHPLYIGLLVMLWSASTMSVGRMIFATITTLYIVVGTKLEERKLVEDFGDSYCHYQKEVPGFFPRFSPYRPQKDLQTKGNKKEMK